MMSTLKTSAVGGTVRFSVRNRVGFVLALLMGMSDLPSVLTPVPDGEVGPPLPVLVLSSLCGLVTVVGVVVGWSRRRPEAIRAAAGARVLSAVIALPALFVDGLPDALRVLVAVSVLVTIVTVVLMLSPARPTDQRSRAGEEVLPS